MLKKNIFDKYSSDIATDIHHKIILIRMLHLNCFLTFLLEEASLGNPSLRTPILVVLGPISITRALER